MFCLEDAAFGLKRENVTKIDSLWRSNPRDVAQAVLRFVFSGLLRLHVYPLAFEGALSVRSLISLPFPLPLLPYYLLPNVQVMLHQPWKPRSW